MHARDMAQTSCEDSVEGRVAPVARTKVMLVVCTYQRNDPLRRLLEATIVAAAEVKQRASTGVVVVDDDPEGGGRAVVDEFAGRFELGAHYRHSGKRNVSIARNLALETGARLADWVAMTDDDCEPPARWLAAHLDAQAQTDCDATTGSMVLRAPLGAPSWLLEEPFFEDYAMKREHLMSLPATGTNNVMLRSAWLLAHPEIRFLEQLGRTGGEDWVFFRTACKAGLTLRFSMQADIIGHESLDRLTWRYQLKNRFWLGNAEWFVNSLLQDEPRSALLDVGWERLAVALVRVVRGLPRYHYSVALLVRSVGYLVGAVGVRVRHH